MQETYLEAFEHINELYHHENPKGWIMQTAKNKAMTITHRLYVLQHREINTGNVPIADRLDRDPSKDPYLFIDDCLQKDELKTVNNIYGHHYSDKDAASIEKLSYGAFRMRLYRIKKKVKKYYQSIQSLYHL